MRRFRERPREKSLVQVGKFSPVELVVMISVLAFLAAIAVGHI